MTTFEQFQAKLKINGYGDLGRTLKGIGRMNWPDAQKNTARELAGKFYGGAKAPAVQDAPAKKTRAKKGAKAVAAPVKKTRAKKAEAAPAVEAPKRRGKAAAAVVAAPPVAKTRVKKNAKPVAVPVKKTRAKRTATVAAPVAAAAAPVKKTRAARGSKLPKAPKQTRKPTASAEALTETLDRRIAQAGELMNVFTGAINTLRPGAGAPHIAEALDNANNGLAELLNSFQNTLVKPFIDQFTPEEEVKYRRFIAVAPVAPAGPTNGQGTTTEQ